MWLHNQQSTLVIKITFGCMTQHTQARCNDRGKRKKGPRSEGWAQGRWRGVLVRWERGWESRFHRQADPVTNKTQQLLTHLQQQPIKQSAANTDLSMGVCVCVPHFVSLKCPGNTLYGLPDKQHLLHHLLMISAHPTSGSFLSIHTHTHTHTHATSYQCLSFLVQLLSSNIMSAVTRAHYNMKKVRVEI